MTERISRGTFCRVAVAALALSLVAVVTDASEGYRALPVDLSFFFTNYRPQVFVENSRIKHEFCGVGSTRKGGNSAFAADPGGPTALIINLSLGWEMDVIAGCARGGNGDLVMLANRKPASAADVGRAVIAVVDRGGKTTAAFELPALPGGGATTGWATFPDWYTHFPGGGSDGSFGIVGSAEAPDGRIVPVLWTVPGERLLPAKSTGNEVAIETIELVMGPGRPDRFEGAAQAVVASASGDGFDIVGTVRSGRLDAIVAWPDGDLAHRPDIVGRGTGRQPALSVADAAQASGSAGAGVVGTAAAFHEVEGGPSMPRGPISFHRSGDRWRRVPLSLDGTSMATPAFMDYTDDTAFMVGGNTLLRDGDNPWEIGTLWRGLSQAPRSGATAAELQVLQDLSTGPALDVNRITDTGGSALFVTDVVDRANKGVLLVTTADPKGNLRGALLVPSSRGSGSKTTTLFADLLRDNRRGELLEGPYSVWSDGSETVSSSRRGRIHEVDITAGFSDYNNVTCITFPCFANVKFTMSVESPDLEAKNLIASLSAPGASASCTTTTAAKGERLAVSGDCKLEPSSSGVLAIRLLLRAPSSFRVEIDGVESGY